MDGVVYYPYIRVPESAWFSRAVLYWDSVATIVPGEWIDAPDQLGPYTLDLVQRDLVVQLFPSYADLRGLATRFIHYINHLGEIELAQRQDDFYDGLAELIHVEKGTDELFRHLADLRLCSPAEGWWRVELKTASDYMAALALALSTPGHQIRPVRGDPRILHRADDVRRVPITDQPHSLLPLLGNTVQATDSELRARAEGQTEVGHIQMMILKKLFPAPVTAVAPSDLERFKRRRGDLLSNFRREVEERVDTIFNLTRDWEQQRALDRLESDFEDAIEQVEAYMHESRFGRLLKSPWCVILGLIPGFDLGTRAAAAIADIALPSPQRIRSPLAYAAFANVELPPSQYRPRVLRQATPSLITMASEIGT